MVTTLLSSSLRIAQERHALATKLVSSASNELAAAAAELSTVTATAHRQLKLVARRHNESTCLLLALLGPDLLRRCLTVPCRDQTIWGGQAGLSCKELGRLACTSCAFHAGLIEEVAQCALQHLSTVERGWTQPWNASWLQTLATVQRMSSRPRFVQPRMTSVATVFGLSSTERRLRVNKCVLHEDGAGCSASTPATFVCTDRPLVTGIHTAQFTIVGDADDLIVGVGPSNYGEIDCGRAGFGISGRDGCCHFPMYGNSQNTYPWQGQQRLTSGDTLGLVLDFRLAATHACLTVYKNGLRLGVAAAIDCNSHDRKWFWTVTFGRHATGYTKCTIADWQPPAADERHTAASDGTWQVEFQHEMARMAGIRAEEARDSAHTQDPQANRIEAIAWLPTLVSQRVANSFCTRPSPVHVQSTPYPEHASHREGRVCTLCKHTACIWKHWRQSSAVQDAIAAIDAIPEQFTESRHEHGLHLTREDVEISESPHDDLDLDFHNILRELPNLRHQLNILLTWHLAAWT
jgi:hypothetical protein